MKYVEFIIFDLDGTLVDSKEDMARGVNFTLKKIGLGEKSTSQISSHIGKGIEDLIRGSLGNKQEALLDRALSIFIEYYRKHSTDNTVLYPHVKEILEYFRDKRKTIVTNRNYEFALMALNKLGIRDYFENIVGGDDTCCMKPSSCPLDRSMGRFNADKEKAIIVGDMDIDILAGRRAGITTCGVTYGIGRKEDIIKAKPDFIIDDIIDLKNIVH